MARAECRHSRRPGRCVVGLHVWTFAGREWMLTTEAQKRRNRQASKGTPMSTMGCVPVSDTHPAMREKQIELLRSAGEAGRWRRMCDLTDAARERSRRAIRERFPDATEGQRNRIFVELHYGKTVARLMDR